MSKNFENIGGKILLGLVALALLFQLSQKNLISAFANSFQERLTHQCVSLVQRDTGNNGDTVKESFNKFFNKPKWKYLYTEEGNIVEFQGKCKYLNKDANVVIQYLVSENKKAYRFYAMEINEIPQNKLVYVGLMKAVFNESKSVNSEQQNQGDTIHNNEQCTPSYDGDTLKEAEEQDTGDYEYQGSYD